MAVAPGSLLLSPGSHRAVSLFPVCGTLLGTIHGCCWVYWAELDRCACSSCMPVIPPLLLMNAAGPPSRCGCGGGGSKAERTLLV